MHGQDQGEHRLEPTIPLPSLGSSACVGDEGGVWVRVGSLAGCLGEHCHHLQALLADASPCFDPKPKFAIPFHLPVESILRAGRWIELLWLLPFLSQNKAFTSHCTIPAVGTGHCFFPLAGWVGAREVGLDF